MPACIIPTRTSAVAIAIQREIKVTQQVVRLRCALVLFPIITSKLFILQSPIVMYKSLI